MVSYGAIPDTDTVSHSSSATANSRAMLSRRDFSNDYSDEPGATIVSSMVNLLNTIIGAGILAMPFAYRANGIVLGTAIIILAGLSAGFGLYLQGLSSTYVPRGHSSFFAIAKVTYPSLAVVFDIAIAVKCFGVGVSYIIIIGDLMPQIAESFGSSSSILLHRQFWVAVSFGIVGPLSFLRKLDSLKYTSVVALVSVGYLVVVVLVHFFVGDTLANKGPIKVFRPEGLPAILNALPIIVFAFTCHQNMFSVLNELSYVTESRVKRIAGGSIGTAGVFYVLVGLCGYLSFGDNVGGNIISMYPFSVFSTIGRIAIVVLVIFSYPLQCHPCRASVNHVMHSIRRGVQKHKFAAVLTADDASDHGDEEVQTTHTTVVPMDTQTFVTITSVILALSLLVALSVDSLELMLAFVGSTGSTSISFILPGIFAYSLLGKTSDISTKERIIRYCALALSLWGIFVATVCLGTNIWLLVR
ncbi:vacuolar amino acid transporter 6 [Trichomonascus vanleenenianus]|uniref:aspartate/glutamate transporter n=1 Tax=Trichomonascus vanleenenianus TaxID=2268995 RepID=UPI003EC97DB9